MVTREEVAVEDSSYEISLKKLIGKDIKDVRGMIVREYFSFMFELTRIEFEDGTFLDVEGEHDLPYLVEYDIQPNFDEETFEAIYQ